MIKAVFAIPGDINLPTGGYAYDRRVLALLPDMGVDASHLELPGSFPNSGDADLEETRCRLAATPSQSVLLIDGLAYGAMPSRLIAGIGRRIVALVHHPLCLEAGLSAARREELRCLEHAALKLAREVIVTSRTTAATLHGDFQVPQAKITVAEPGTDRAPRARGTKKPLRLLAVGAIVPRKALPILVRALVHLRDVDWRLDVVGPSDRSSEAVAELRHAIAETGLANRITLHGSAGQPALDAHYDAADIFVMPSLYEGYGMVLAEAMARGLPIVCTTGGAAADTVPDAAGIKVPPGDVQAFAEALGQIARIPDLRRRMSDASWAAGQVLPQWEDTARLISGVLRRAAQ